MGLIIGIFLTFFGLVGIFLTGEKKGSFMVLFYFIWVFIIPFLVDIFVPLEGEDYFDIITWSSYFSILIFPISIIESRKRRNSEVRASFSQLSVIYVIIILYGVFLGLSRGTVYHATKYIFMQFSPILMLANIFFLKPRKVLLINTVHRLLYLELIVGGLQLLGFFQYHMNSNASNFDFGRITGTFSGNNIYAEVISLLMFFVVYIDYSRKNKIELRGWAIVAIGFLLMITSGIRTALIGYAICMFFIIYSCYKNNKKGRRILFVFIVLGALYFVKNMLGGILTSDMVYDAQTDNAFDRQGTLANILRDDNYLTEQTTFAFTIYVLSFLPMNYLFGPGLLYTTSQGYGGVVNLATQNLTDAAMAIYICETGLLGVCLFVLLYYIVLKKINRSKIALVFFLYLLLIYVTDLGPSFLPNSIFLYLIIYIESIGSNQENYRNDYIHKATSKSIT